MQKLVKLLEIRADVCNARGNANNNDPKHVLYLVSLLEAGIAFKDRLLLTSDLVLLGGHHRTEAYLNFFANLHKGNAEALAGVTVAAEVLPESWDDSTELERVALRIKATVEDNDHVGGRPYTAYDIRQLIGKIKNGPSKLSQKEIKEKLSQTGVPACWIVAAFKALLDIEMQAKHRLAREFKKQGYPIVEALEKAGLPPTTDLVYLNAKNKNKVRQNKLKKAADVIDRQWSRMFDEHYELYENGVITQATYRNLPVEMKIQIDRLYRKASGYDKRVEEHLRDTAGLIRSVGVSEKLPKRTV
jgi:hypothetical protein